MGVIPNGLWLVSIIALSMMVSTKEQCVSFKAKAKVSDSVEGV